MVTQRRRAPALDGIRGCAILAVFASHAVPHAGGGWMGVEVFFVLSGYLITSLLMDEARKNGRISFGKFYMRRVLRLYPALIVLLLLGLLFYKELSDEETLASYGRAAAAAGLYVQDFVWGFTRDDGGGFGHTWSLAVEEQFYLFWPPILYLLIRWRRQIAPLCVGLALVSLAITALVDHGAGDPPGAYFLPWVQAPLLLAGCALAATKRRLDPSTAVWLGPAAGAGLVALTGIATQFPRVDYLAPLLATAAVLATALVAAVEAAPDSPFARLLSARPIEFLGRISYGFYLYYLVVVELVEHRIESQLVAAPLELVLIFSCAVVSYYVVEQPFLRLKRRYYTPATAPQEERPRQDSNLRHQV